MKNLIMKTGSLLLSALVIAIIYSSCAKPSPADTNSVYHNELSKSLKNYEIFSLDFDAYYAIAKTKPTTPVTINLNIPGHPNWKFDMIDDDLKQYDEDGFQMIEIGANDAQIVIQENERFALQGKLNKNNLKSFLTFSLGKMEGLVQDKGDEYWIQSLSNYVEDAPNDLYVIFNGKDEFVEGKLCGTDEQAVGGQGSGSTRAAPKKIYITYLGDYQFYQEFNNTTTASNWMYWRYYYANKRYNAYNAVPFIFTRRTGYLYSWSGSANYNPKTISNRQTFVDECSDFYSYSWYNEGDVNYFFTGDQVEGVFGKADGISRMCSDPSQAFSFGEVGTRAANPTSNTYFGQNLMAHEVGHTVATGHDETSNNWMHTKHAQWNTSVGWQASSNFTDKYNNGSWCLGY